MSWFWVWLSFAVLMFFLMVVHPTDPIDILVAFVAWCGGVVSLKIRQQQRTRRAAKRA
jgi:hypothetical protein